MKETIQALANRVLEAAEAMKRSTAATERLVHGVERLVVEVRDAEAKAEIRELGYKDDLRRNTERLAVISDDVKDVLEIRKREAERDHPVLAGLKVIVSAPTTKFALLVVVVVLGVILAVAEGWIKVR